MVGGDAAPLIEYLSQSDPDFAAFAKDLKGKTPEQGFAQHGLDFKQFSGLI